MKAMTKNENGSVLVWAAAVVLVASVLIMSVIGAAYSSHKRTVERSLRRQLELSASGAVRLVAEVIVKQEGEVLRNAVITRSPEVIFAENIFDEQGMGSCVISVRLNESGELVVEALAQINGLSAEYSAYISQSGGEWVVSRYADK